MSRWSATSRDKHRPVAASRVRPRPRRGNEAGPLHHSAPASLSARSLFYCSRRFGASRSPRISLALLTRRLPTAGLRSRWSVAPAGRLISQPTYVLCLRKTRGRKLPERSTSRSNFSARPRSLWSRRRRRRPRGARATRDAQLSATKALTRCRHHTVAALALLIGGVRREAIIDFGLPPEASAR